MPVVAKALKGQCSNEDLLLVAEMHQKDCGHFDQTCSTSTWQKQYTRDNYKKNMQ